MGAPSQQVTVTLPQHEYVALRDRADADSSRPAALLEVPDRREREQADDGDAPFEPARTQPAATQQLADVKLADQQRQAAHATARSCDPDSASPANKRGHFAAWEEPELFSKEMRAAFGSVR